MKRFTYSALMAAMISVAVLFSGCGGGGSQSPEAVAEKYIAAMMKMDVSDMKKYASEKGLAQLEEQEEVDIMSNVPAEKQELLKSFADAKTTVQPAEIDPDDPNKAEVDVDYILNYQGNESDGKWKVMLVKEGDEWKVDDLSLK